MNGALRTALIFPGQGLQHVGMGASLTSASAAAADVFACADAVLGLSLSTYCFSGPEDTLRQTAIAQPAILTHSIAAFRAAESSAPLEWQVAVGHSLGEWSALVAAGALTFEDALRLVHLRGQLMQAAVADGVGAMVAILGLDGDAVAALCEVAAQGEVVSIATYNGAQNLVVSGHVAAVARLSALAIAGGAQRVQALPVSAPFHCSLMAPAAAGLASALADIEIRPPRRAVVSTVSGAAEDDPERWRLLLVEQLVAPVRFSQAIGLLAAQGVTVGVALGPATSLKGMVRRIEATLKVRVVESGEHLAMV